MMKSFDIKRFGKTLRWVVSVNFRKLLLWFAGSVLAVFLGEFLFKMMNPGGDPQEMLRNFSQFLVLILTVVSLIMISSIVSSINEKRKREAFLMLPSSNLEKYLSLLVYSTVICIVCALVAVVLGDSLRMFAYWVTDYQGMPYADGSYCHSAYDEVAGGQVYWWSSSIPRLLNELTPHIIANGLAAYPTSFVMVQLAFIYGGMLWLHSVYTLGGTLLRKYSFVGTSVIVILLLTLAIKITVAYELTLFNTQWDHGKLLEYEIGIIGWILAIAFPILSMINYWASFHVFKRFQLITNKWTNYDFHK
jgi:hypothetical protein